GAPGGFSGLSFLRPREKIASFQNERASFAAFDAASHGIFPISGMQGEFPDVVTAGCGAPGRLTCGNAFERLAQIRAVPGFVGIAFAEKCQNQIVRFHAGSRTCDSRPEFAPAGASW